MKIKLLVLMTCLTILFSPAAKADILMDFHLDAWDEYGYPETSFQVVFNNFKDIIDGLVGPSSLISPIPNDDPYILGAKFYFPDPALAAGYMNKVGVYYTGAVEGGQEPGGWSGYPWDRFGTYTHPSGYFTLSGVPGTALAWGRNASGQLGEGTALDSRAPLIPVLPGAATAIAAGGAFSLALDSDGSVWAWGSNDFGQLGNDTFTDSDLPVRVKDPAGTGFLTGIVTVAAGYDHALALDRDGRVFGWGANDAGQLSVDPDAPLAMDRYNLPRQIIPSGSGVRAIAAGQQFSLALGACPGDEGCVSAWGINDFGQLGRGDTEKHAGRDTVTRGADTVLWNIQSIAAGWNHALALDRDGKVWAWGKNEFGQLGVPVPAPPLSPSSPIAIRSGAEDMTAIAAGLGYSLAVNGTHNVLAWGGNWEGQLGDGTKTDRYTPAPVMISATEILGGITTVSGGRFHSLALGSYLGQDDKPYRRLWAWGDNQSGALGRDPVETPESLYAIAVKDYGGQNDLGRILDCAAGNLFSLALEERGFDAAVVLSSSANPAVPGAAVTFTAVISPVKAEAGTPTGTVVFKDGHTILGSAALVNGEAAFTTSSLGVGYHEVTALYSGEGFTSAASAVLRELIDVPIRIVTTVMPSGMKDQPYGRRIVHTGGYGPSEWSIVEGRLPEGLTLGNGIVSGTPAAAGTYRFTVQVRNSGFADSAALTLRIHYPGRLLAWGDPDYDGTLMNVVSVSAGEGHGVLLDSDGKVWAWGNNDYGQLGDGQTCDWPCPPPVTVPIQPVGLDGRTFTQVVAGGSHGMALESSGQAWIWGVSDSNLPAASWDNPVPIRIEKEQGIALDGITALALGRDHAWGLSEAGTVYMLGPYAEPVKGQDGNGTLQDVVAVAAWGWYTLALARDGSVYEWGHYTYYDSDGYTQWVSRPFPSRVEVESGTPLTNIVAIAAGENFGIALDRAGRVWAWGLNTVGQLGQGVSAPTLPWSQFALPVKSSGGGTLSDIVSISAGGSRCLALDSQGRLWGWGNYASLPNDLYTGNPGMGYVTGFSAGGEFMAMILSGLGGDLNGDGAVGLADAVLCLKLVAGVPAGEARLDGVVTGEPKIGLGEALYILQGIAGLRQRGGD